MKLIPIVTVALLVSCGGHTSDVGPSSGLPRSSTIGSLTPSDAAVLCDWTNGKQGGYGRVVNCPDGSQQGTDPNKSSCVQSVHDIGLGCPTLTVADIEDCANAIGADVCALATNAACANAVQCFNSIGI